MEHSYVSAQLRFYHTFTILVRISTHITVWKEKVQHDLKKASKTSA